MRPITSFVVVGRDRTRADALVQRLERDGCVGSVGTPDAVSAADIVACATTAREPLFDGSLLPPSACAVAVGSHDPTARELDDVVFHRAVRVVVETAAVALREAGDVVLAVRSETVAANDLIDIAEVVHLSPANVRSVFKSVGMGWQDLVVAGAAHARWQERTGA